MSNSRTSAPRHKAPPRHKAARDGAFSPSRVRPVLKPTFTVVTCASLGLGGVAAGAQQFAHAGLTKTAITLSDVAAPAHMVTASTARSASGTGSASRAAVKQRRSATPDSGASGHGSGTARSQAPNHAPTRTPSPRASEQPAAPRPSSSAQPKHRAEQAPSQPPAVATGGGTIDREAVERKRAAERAARARERAEQQAEEAAEQAAAAASSGDPQAIARQLASARGWGDEQFSCLVTLWDHESSWDVHASNSGSGAYGIPQALPGEKMAAYGPDWQDNAETQIKWGLDYISDRYDTPCGAWSYWQVKNWY